MTFRSPKKWRRLRKRNPGHASGAERRGRSAQGAVVEEHDSGLSQLGVYGQERSFDERPQQNTWSPRRLHEGR